MTGRCRCGVKDSPIGITVNDNHLLAELTMNTFM